MQPRSDFQINSAVRSVLTRQWIDLQKINIRSFRGTVRLTGEMRGLGGGGNKVDPTKLEAIESGIRRVRGVARVYFDLSNWYRTSEGAWKPKKSRVRAAAPRSPSSVEKKDAAAADE